MVIQPISTLGEYKRYRIQFVALTDHSFFNMTPMEAQWLDPQQRKMLEVTFEALQSAGLTLDTVAGSNTAVFVGSFTSDYRVLFNVFP